MGDMIRENGNIITAADEVRVQLSKWGHDEYTLAKNKGQEYILCRPKEERDLWEWSTINSRDYLDSLIVLAFDTFHNKEKEAHLMKRWCQKYGFPFLGSGVGTMGCENESYKDFGPEVGCSVWGFHCALRHLRNSFLAASALFTVNIGLIEDYENYYDNGNLFNEVEIQQAFNNSLIYARMCSQIDFSSSPPSLYWELYTPVAASLYHLSLLAIAPDGFIVKRCYCCNSLFVSERSNKKYCINCSPAKKYKKTYKGKKG